MEEYNHCKKIKEFLDRKKQENNIPYVLINLPIELLEDQTIVQIINNNFGYESNIVEKIIFSFVEKQLSELSSFANNKIKEINKAGYKIVFDDYGIGYTNSEVLLNLKLFGVRVKKSSILELENKGLEIKFISLLKQITNDIDIKLICKGFNTIEEKQILSSIGITYFQN